MTEIKPCPECGQEIAACPPPCSMWDCAFYGHLGSVCPSERGQGYRKMIAASIRLRDEAALRAHLKPPRR